MKNLSVVFNVILTIAVAILFYLHFKGNNNSVSTTTGTETPMAMPVTAKGIVYINSDTLLDNIKYYADMKKEFEAEQTRVKNELKSESDKLQADAQLYQKQAIGMTDMERQQTEGNLGMRQQALMQKKDDLLSRLDEKQGKSSEELYARISNYLHEFNKGKNYQFVLGYQKGGGILFANDSLDITKQIIEGLNKQYEEEKEK
jgi:outer membrane protein